MGPQPALVLGVRLSILRPSSIHPALLGPDCQRQNLRDLLASRESREGIGEDAPHQRIQVYAGAWDINAQERVTKKGGACVRALL